MDEVKRKLDTNKGAFLNQATYEAAIMACIHHLPNTVLTLKELCELNSKRFLPYWGLVFDKVFDDTMMMAFLLLFQSMIYGIRPFLDNRSSYKHSTCAFESLSQSIERHLLRLLGFVGRFYESELNALRLGRMILKHTGRSFSETGVIIKNLIALHKFRRNDLQWEHEISKFICLLIPFVESIPEAEVVYLEKQDNEFFMRCLVRRFPARYTTSISSFNDEIVIEYLLGSFSMRMEIDPKIVQRITKHDAHLKKLIPLTDKMSAECLTGFVENCTMDNMTELCKYAPSSIHSKILNICIQSANIDGLANLLNREIDVPLIKENLIALRECLGDSTEFAALRCWLGLAKSGFHLQASISDHLVVGFTTSRDPKFVILASMIFLHIDAKPAAIAVENKICEFEGNLRVQKHLLALIH